MDQRFEERYPADFEVVLTDLNGRMKAVHGRVSNISKSGICVRLPHPIAPGSLVRLDFADSVLFGYARYSGPEEAGFQTGIEVERVLLSGSCLAHILHDILKQEMPDVPGLEFVAP